MENGSRVIPTYPFVSLLVVLSHSLVLRLDGWIDVGPFFAQLLGNVADTVLWIQCLYFCAFVVAEPEESRSVGTQKVQKMGGKRDLVSNVIVDDDVCWPTSAI